MTRRLPACLALATLFVFAAGSIAEAQTRHREPARPRPPSRADIMLYQRFPADIRLAVTSVNGQRPVASDRPIFTFTGNLWMSGFGGCNPVHADFRRPGISDLRFGPLNFVEKRCGQPVDRQERAIFWAIQGANKWRPHGTRGMVLTGVRGTVTLEPAF
jgi:heat shock protein HslJ